MRRNHLKGRDGDRINAVLAAAGYNFNLLLRWFDEFLRATFLIVLSRLLAPTLRLNRPSKTFFTGPIRAYNYPQAAAQAADEHGLRGTRRGYELAAAPPQGPDLHGHAS